MKSMFLSLIFVLLFSATLQAREVTIRTVDWPPYFSSELKNYGPLVEITREALKFKGHKADIRFIPWKRALEEVKAGKFDMIIGAYDTDQRRKDYIYTERIYEVKESIIGLKSTGVTTFNNINDLKKYKFGITRGYAYSKEFSNASGLNKKVADSDLANIKKLFGGRIDFVVMSSGLFNNSLQKIPKHQQKDAVFLEPSLSINGVFNLISRAIPDGKQLSEDFNAGLKSIKENKVYDQILEDHGI